MSQISRKYKLTVILDTRGYDAPVETLQEKVTGMLKELGGDVTAMENLGRQEFVRVIEKGHTGDTYLLVEASGPTNFPADVQERIRLDKQIKRILIQSA